MKKPKLILPILSAILLHGCALHPQRNPVTSLDLPSGVKLAQLGEAKIPAKIDSSDWSFSTTLPAQSVLVFSLPNKDTSDSNAPKISAKIPSAAPVTIRGNRVSATLAKSFDPPAPPSEMQKVSARFAGKALYFSLGLFVVALVLAYLTHYKAAGFAALGAIAVPIFSAFVSNESAMIICAITLLVSGAIFAAWHFLPDKYKNIL